MLFILFNLALFVASLLLTYFSMLHFDLFLTLPTSLQILIGIGLITPVMNLFRYYQELCIVRNNSNGDQR